MISRDRETHSDTEGPLSIGDIDSSISSITEYQHKDTENTKRKSVRCIRHGSARLRATWSAGSQDPLRRSGLVLQLPHLGLLQHGPGLRGPEEALRSRSLRRRA